VIIPLTLVADMVSTNNTEPGKVDSLMSGYGMTETQSSVSLNVALSEDPVDVSRLGIVINDLCGCLGVTEYIGPFFDLLPEVLWIKDGIEKSMVDQHLGTGFFCSLGMHL